MPTRSRERWLLLLVCSLALPITGANSPLSWTVSCSTDCGGVDTCKALKLCEGAEVQDFICPEAFRKDCPDFVPAHKEVDCSFEEWGDWKVMPGAGLCNRSRFMKPNEWGGAPCVGRTMETYTCMEAMEGTVPEDCKFDDWKDWAPCDMGQHSRARVVLEKSERGGKACDGVVEETEPCDGSPQPQNCKVNDWLEWSGCGDSCTGGGQRSRMRSVVQANYGGALCGGGGEPAVLMETEACSSTACAGTSGAAKDCKLGDWKEWSGCEDGGSQATRSRAVLQGAAFGGTACNETLSEIQPCSSAPVAGGKEVACVMGDWSPWNLCDQSCNGGQTVRERSILTPARNGGAPCEDTVEETKPCNTHPCTADAEGADCLLGTWEEWGVCSAKCGTGSQTRTRTIVFEAQAGGRGCNAQLDEVQPCEGDAVCSQQKDCQWEEWAEWSACSRSCGHAFRSKKRQIEIPPSQGGAPCDVIGSTEVLEACHQEPCQEGCVDGTWGQWTAWSLCTASCGKGARWRNRVPASEANHCGKPAIGDATEVNVCNEQACEGEDVDCQLSVWGVWSECSATCSGQQERSRGIQTMSKGGGKPCNGASLKEVQSCNGPDDMFPDDAMKIMCGFGKKVPCELGEWGPWSECTKHCDGGQHLRERSLPKQFSGFSVECSGSIQEQQACGTQPCEPAEDCQWGDWDEWSPCSACQGEQMRHRQILRPSRRHGSPCAKEDSLAVRNCEGECPQPYYCVFGPWEEQHVCMVTCGTGTITRQRMLQAIPEKPSDPKLIVGIVSTPSCSGLVLGDGGVDAAVQSEVVACDGLPACEHCSPVDCSLTQWSEWSQPNCSGVVTRQRSVYIPANQCGKPCAESLVSAKAELAEGCAQDEDCAFSDWTPWSGCENKNAAQQYRTREMGRPGAIGKPCSGHLKETMACGSDEVEEVMCEPSDWSAWSECSRKCGGGQQDQSREIPRTHSGKPCKPQALSLSRTRACNDVECKVGLGVDCELSEWSDWEGCAMPGSLQGLRSRKVVREAEGGGLACQGALRMSGACPAEQSVDCEFEDWAPWGECDSTCGGGQVFRTREVRQAAQNGGATCSGTLHQTQPCNEIPCSSDDCAVSLWSEWSDCDAACDQGQQTRSRFVTKPPWKGGAGCGASLKEIRGCEGSESCKGKVEHVDCKWSEWAPWGPCQAAIDCGVGFRSRSRRIERLPKGQGKPCSAWDAEEVAPSLACPGACGGDCEESAWSTWGAWSECSASCGRGLQQRTREIAEQASASCGPPTSGTPSEFQSCLSSKVLCEHNRQADCEFSDWGDWQGECSAKCSGHHTRARTVAKQAKEGGQACEGPLQVSARCNPGPGEPEPEGCDGHPPQDCELAEWSDWSECSASCDVGQAMRSRAVLIEPAWGGKECPSSLQELRMCQVAECSAMTTQDCQWADWLPWGSCDPIRGEQSRSRTIASQRVLLGKPCEGSVREVQQCDRTCEDKLHVCAWGKWSAWSECSATCGLGGRVSRKRSLQLQEDVGVITDDDELESKAAFPAHFTAPPPLEQAVSHLAAAFTAGGLGVAVLLCVVRIVGARRHLPHTLEPRLRQAMVNNELAP